MKKNPLNQIYSVIGSETESIGLDNLFSRVTLAEQEQIFGACSRLHLIDSIQYTKLNFESWALLNADALQIYLLCTCFDALSDRSIEGVGKRFKSLFRGLNEHLENELVQSYLLLQEPRETFQTWESLNTESKMKRIVEYIYELRRNTFTHEAKIVPAAFAVWGIGGPIKIIPEGIWKDNKGADKYSVHFNYRFRECSEPSLLRLIIIGKIRLMLELDIDETFISYYWNNLKKFYNPQHKITRNNHKNPLLRS